MESLLHASATDIASRIRTGLVSSRDVVDLHIERTERVNPRLNAMVATRFDEARREANAADRMLAEAGPDAVPPFHGVPCSIKESFQVRGMPNTAGLVARRDLVIDDDAVTVERYRKAGAIVLGVTNTSELCMWMESNNRVYGRSQNPYDPRRIVGGSSGGEGAIVGAGAVPFGLGADVGGSIRMPAFFNGVFGHKPTGGMVPNSGQYPEPENDARRYCTTGPLTRRAEDLYPLLALLAGPDGEDDGCTAMPLHDPATVDVSSLRVTSVPDDGGRTPVSDDLRAAQERAAEHLASLGCEVRTTRVPELKRALEIWSAMMSEADDTSFSVLLADGERFRPLREIGRLVRGRSDHTLPSVALTILERGMKYLPQGTQKLVEMGRELRAALVELIGENGIMLYPPYAEPAPLHNRPLMRPTQWVYTAALNVMELPSTQVPLGLNDHGVPLGVQVVGLHGNDHIGIAVALELERAFGGWVFPSRL